MEHTVHIAPSRGSYPSKQPRFGPAPLASFEDLPTDEQGSSSEDDRRNSIVNISSNIEFLVTDHDLHQNVRHTFDRISPIHQQLDAKNQLFLPPQSHDNKRKGSWADFLFLRKSPTKVKERKFSLFNFKFFSKEDNKKNGDLKAKTSPSSHTIFSLNTSELESCSKTQSYQPKSLTPVELSVSPNSFDTVVEVGVACGSQNDDTKTFTDCHSLNDSLCSLEDVSAKDILVEEVKEKCCTTTDYETECAECAACDRIIITCADCADDTDCFNPADNEDNDEPGSSSNQSSYDSFELQSLLKGDQLDPTNQTPEVAAQSQPPKLTLNLEKTSKLNLKLSSEKLKTSPIDRPRSITPININSFEAYLANQPPSISLNNSECDKLTITLPGPQFNPRNKFSRKSNPFIWQEFCEKGLKSPHALRRRANSCFPQLNQNTPVGLLSPETNLTPITPILNPEDTGTGQQCRFDDNFWDYSIRQLNESEMGDVTKKEHSFTINNLRNQCATNCCSCDCGGANSEINTTPGAGSTTTTNWISLTTCSDMSSFCETASEDNETSPKQSCRSEFNEDQPLVSPCDCVCHHRGRPETNDDHDEKMITELLNQTRYSKQPCCDTTTTTTEDDDDWQLSPSTLSSSTSAESNRLLESSTTSSG